jgi:hypothetical protein
MKGKLKISKTRLIVLIILNLATMITVVFLTRDEWDSTKSVTFESKSQNDQKLSDSSKKKSGKNNGKSPNSDNKGNSFKIKSPDSDLSSVTMDSELKKLIKSFYKNPHPYYSLDEKKKIVKDILKSGKSLQWKKMDLKSHIIY